MGNVYVFNIASLLLEVLCGLRRLRDQIFGRAHPRAHYRFILIPKHGELLNYRPLFVLPFASCRVKTLRLEGLLPCLQPACVGYVSSFAFLYQLSKQESVSLAFFLGLGFFHHDGGVFLNLQKGFFPEIFEFFVLLK